MRSTAGSTFLSRSGFEPEVEMDERVRNYTASAGSRKHQSMNIESWTSIGSRKETREDGTQEKGKRREERGERREKGAKRNERRGKRRGERGGERRGRRGRKSGKETRRRWRERRERRNQTREKEKETGEGQTGRRGEGKDT